MTEVQIGFYVVGFLAIVIVALGFIVYNKKHHNEHH